MKKLITVLLSMSGLLLGYPVSVTFLGPSTLNNINGTSVGPSDLTVNGVAFLGTRTTWNLAVGPPWVWEANDLTMAAIPRSETSTWLEAEWLNQQFSGNSDWAGIQKAIWGLFGGPYSDSDTLQWEQSARQNYQSVANNSFYMLFPENIGEAPTFLVTVPEPVMFGLIGFGLLALGVLSLGRFGKPSHAK